MSDSLPGDPLHALLARFEQTFDEWFAAFPQAALPIAMLRHHFGYDDASMRKGKRLRPRLLLTLVAQECPDDETAICDAVYAACAIEALHNYSLIHDDIEDGDELRHGRTTVWARYGAAHGINAGDALCAVSYLALLRKGCISTPGTAQALAACLLDAHLAMCIGQGQDIDFESRDRVGYDEYLEMIGGKTAALFGAACEMGAITASLTPQRQAAYAEYGRLYGRAFQIRDDILGTWGSVAATGKPSGADIARRKWSFPVAWALSGPPSSERELIANAYAHIGTLDHVSVERVVAALDSLGARAAADSAAATALAQAAELAAEHGIDGTFQLRSLFEASAKRIV